MDFLDYAAVSRSFASVALLAAALGVALMLLLAVPAGRRRLAWELEGRQRLVLGLAALVAAGASGASLYYSEVVGFVPCVLCWYQRIAMYPLVAVLGVGALAGDGRAWRYGLPLSVAGLLTSAYHVTIQFRPSLDVGACTASVPCTARYVAEFGFVSIPVMAGSGFILITALLLALPLARSLDPAGEEEVRPQEAPAPHRDPEGSGR